MKISTISFDMLIGNEYFPGYKVTKPFYCTVCYEFNEQTDEHKLLYVSFGGNTLSYFRSNPNFSEDIHYAILNNIESNKNREVEVRAISDEAWQAYKESVGY